jgi:hypothetical protein
MRNEEIKDRLNQMIKQLGVADNVTGIADEKIGYGNYQRLMKEYQVLLHNLITLTAKMAENYEELERRLGAIEGPKIHPPKPKAGSFS